MNLAVALLVVGSAVAAAGETPVAVPVVKTASLEVLEWEKPEKLAVKATGEVPSLGYTAPTLARVLHAKPPKDGVQDFAFTVVPPDGAAGQALAEVSAEAEWAGYKKAAPWLKGVRVKGAGKAEKVLWLKADVVVEKDATSGKAKAGQVVEVRTTYGVLPVMPSDFAVTVAGKAVPFNGFSGLVRVDGRPVVGASLYRYFFRIDKPGKVKVVVSYKLGDATTEKAVELDVTK